MANKDFDQAIFNVRERPLSSDWNQAQSQIHRTLRDLTERLVAGRTTIGNDVALVPSGMVGDGLKVRPKSPASMQVTIAAGMGFQVSSDKPSAIGGISGLDDLSGFKPLYLSADETITIATAPGAGNERYDLLEVKFDRRAENLLNRDVFNTSTKVFDPTNVNKTLAFDLSGRQGQVAAPANSTTGIGYKTGIVAATGNAVVPTTTAGYELIAVIYVGPAVASIDSDVIRDQRKLLWPYGLARFSARLKYTNTGGVLDTAVQAAAAPHGTHVLAIPQTVQLFDVFVIAGGMSFSSVVAQYTASTVGGAGPAAGQLIFPGTPIIDAAYTLTSGNVADLNNAAKTSPAVKLAAGQPAVRITFPAGITSSNAAWAPATFSLQAGDFGTYQIDVALS